MNYPRVLLAVVAAVIVFFAWGFLTEGWLIRRDFVPSATLYRSSEWILRQIAYFSRVDGRCFFEFGGFRSFRKQ